jgi:23S rRNA (uracil1939-C5)-methyltransferase
LKLTIEKLIYGGDGLARLPADEHGRGKAVFVPFVLPGEEVAATPVEEKPGFVRARVDDVIRPSPRRIVANCPYFLRCGGCHYQHTDYEHQVELKTEILKENLSRLAKTELTRELKRHPSPAWNYRNRTRLKLQTAPEFAIGYFRWGSHELLPVEECPISSPLINRAIAACWELGHAGRFPAEASEIEVFVNAADTELLAEIYIDQAIEKTGAQLKAEMLKAALPNALGVTVFQRRQLRESGESTRIASAGVGEMAYATSTASYRVSSGAFFQVNRFLTDELVELVTGGQSGGAALDLYAGVGLFSSVLARQFKQVIAVEASPISHADLRYNAPVNVKVVRSMVEQYLKNAVGKLHPDLVVTDPPRGGLGDSVIHSLVSLGAPRMIYVSCDPATLSRDLGGLLKAGYSVEQAHLVDLFPQTYHMESVFHLVR